MPAHPVLLSNLPEDPNLPPPHIGANLLPYILLPLMGPEEYSDEDTEGMLDECQLLEPDKERESDNEIIKSHLETLLLLTTTPEGREVLRRVKVYPIVRECHLHIENEEVREACDRVVQIIMRKEEGEEEDIPDMSAAGGDAGRLVELKDDEDEEDQLIEVL